MFKNNLKILVFIFLIVVISGCASNSTIKNNSESKSQEGIMNIEKLEVYHFHATKQCYSCITVGAYAEETVNTYFKEELESGKIVFGHINGELLENKELVAKYGSTGSSLWIGTYTKDGTFSAEQNTNVWYKINNKEDYMNYLKEVIEKKLPGE
ncbi:MAG: nitrophenyl compound nitroreductase subunit ArsF family protein [Patescibacteria group bacterium]